jgi:hypothetical protein
MPVTKGPAPGKRAISPDDVHVSRYGVRPFVIFGSCNSRLIQFGRAVTGRGGIGSTGIGGVGIVGGALVGRVRGRGGVRDLLPASR